MTFPAPIPSAVLKLEDVPGEHADLRDINRFALTLDQREAVAISLERQNWNYYSESSSLEELRSRLYLEQRRWNHFGRQPDPETETHIRKMISFIRAKVPPKDSRAER